LGLFPRETFSPNKCLNPQNANPTASPDAFLEALMKLQALSLRSILSKAALASLALGGFLFFAGAPAAKAANPWEDCNRRIAYTNMRYHEAVNRFGPYSSAARHWAFERHEALAHCRY
jgi:hypothetical protein